MVRRLSLKSFKFKIQKSQMQLCTHEVVQSRKIQGQKKKKTEAESEYCTPHELIRHAVPWSASLTQQIQKSYMAVNLQFRGGCLFKHEKPWPPIAIVHGIRPFIKLH